MKKAEDRRIRRTKKQLTEALAELLRQKPLKSITVNELTELADVNRGTFYLHYRNIYDMVDKIRGEIFERFNEIISVYSPHKNELLPLLKELFELLSEYSDLAESLMGRNGDAVFVDTLKNLIKKRCFLNVYDMANTKNDPKLAYFYSFSLTGCLGIFEEWLESGMKETPEQMAAITEELMLKGYGAI